MYIFKMHTYVYMYISIYLYVSICIYMHIYIFMCILAISHSSETHAAITTSFPR